MQILMIAFLVLALSPFVYYFLSFYCVISCFRRLRQPRAINEPFMPPASIIKPVRGMDREAYENFSSFCRLDYPEYELVFAVSDTEDLVIPVIEKLRADFPRHSIRLITGVPAVGANDKINNLCQLVQHARYDFLVMSDSDVRVEPDYLKTVIAPFADPRVGAVTALYKSQSAGNLASNLDALGMYMDSAPSALVAKKIEGKVGFAFGWTMATSKQRLAEIGGWESMVDFHNDDFELGNRIAERGHRVELMAKPVSMIFPKETLGEYLSHELRWSIGLKNVRPTAYCGLAFTHGLPWALLGAAVALSMGSASIAVGFVFSYLVLRIGLTWTTGAWGLGDRKIYKLLWLVPLRDAISFIVWITAFFMDEITWRGLVYQVKNGRLLPRKIPRPKIKTLEPIKSLPKLSHQQRV